MSTKITLRKLIVHLDLRVNHPDVFGNMELEGFSLSSELYCPKRMTQYFQSPYFQADIKAMEDDLWDGTDHGYYPEDFMIVLERDDDHGYHMFLDLVCVDLEDQ